MLDLRQRHETEIAFFDGLVEQEYGPGRSFKLGNGLDYQGLFARINQFKKVAEFFGNIKGRRVLDAGCGTGWVSIYFARSGADAYCCDVSPRSIEVAKRFAGENGLGDRVHASVMPAEHLEYDSGFFDMVFMNTALHHCDVGSVSKEFHRVLKPGGKVAVIEDYAYHPLLNLYRWFTGDRHTPHEKPLEDSDVELFVRPFLVWEAAYLQLFDIWDRDWALKGLLSRCDDALLRKLPALKRYCRLVGIYAIR